MELYGTINSGMDKLEQILLKISYIFIVSMAVIISINVVARHFFQTPIPGVVEFVSRYLMIGTVFLSASYIQQIDGHVRVDLFYQNFSQRRKDLVDYISRLATLGIFVWIAYLVSLETHVRVVQRSMVTSVFPMPTAVSWGAMAVGLWLFCLRMGLQISRQSYEWAI